MEDALFGSNCEPTFDEVLAEPIVRQLMRRDGVAEATTRHLLWQTAAARPAPRLRWVEPKPDIRRNEHARASIGVVSQAAVAPAWPRIFPGL